jgi:putative ABC transport system permease protein
MAVIALRMLFGDRAKYLGLIFGVAFSTLLIAQQGGLFVGLMLRTASVIDDAQEVNIWVMDPQADYIVTVRALRDTELARVRGWRGWIGRCRWRRWRRRGRGMTRRARSLTIRTSSWRATSG